MMRFVTLILLLVATGSCVKDIDLQTPAGVDNYLAIQAKLVKGTPHNFFAKISKVFDFGGRSAPIRVRRVTLANDLGQKVDVPNTDTEEYSLQIPIDSPDFILDDFMFFNLEVETSDNRIYTSTFEQLLPVAKVEQLGIELITETEQSENLFNDFIEVPKVQISISTPTIVPNTNDMARFRWTFEEVFQQSDTPPFPSTVEPKTCYVTQTIGIDVETIHETFDSRPLDNFPILANDLEFNYAEGHYFIVMQHSLTTTAFRYFNSVREIISREASIFNTPAGKILSNFTNLADPNDEAFGYFYATAIDTARIFTSPEMVGKPTTLCPDPDFITLFNLEPNINERPRDCPEARCCDCLNQEKSTLERPDWWLE